MSTIELRARLDAIEDERRQIHTAAGEEPLSDEQQTRWDALDTEETEARTALQTAEEAEQRSTRVRESRARYGANFNPVHKTEDALNSLPATRQGRVDALMRAVDKDVEGTDTQRHVERMFNRHAEDGAWVRNLLGRSTDDYHSAFSKLMTGRELSLTAEERAAVAVGTNTQGGFLVPTQLDPTLILTNTGSANAIRPIARQTTLTAGNVWHGVSTAGVTASFDAELAEVSDDSPSFSNPSVTLFTARAFVQASYEAFEDISNLAGDTMMLFADARDRLEGSMHAVGTGSGQPNGIFHIINATTAHQTVSTTAAAIGLVDLQAIYFALGQRWRNSGTWVMNPTYLLAVQALGTALSASYTSNLAQPLTDQLIGRPVVTTDDAPSAQTTTVKDQEILIGDFSNFLIVDKPGSMSVEFIQNLFNTATNLPDGRRGWIAHWRNGSDCLNTSAFQLLVDKTSA